MAREAGSYPERVKFNLLDDDFHFFFWGGYVSASPNHKNTFGKEMCIPHHTLEAICVCGWYVCNYPLVL